MRKCALPPELATLAEDQIAQVDRWLDRFTYPKVQDLFLDAFKTPIGRMKLCRYNARRLKARALSGPGQLTAADLVAIKNGTPVPDTRLNKDVLLYQTLQMVRAGVKSAYHLRELHQIATYEERLAQDERRLQLDQKVTQYKRRRADLREQELNFKRQVAAARIVNGQVAAAREAPTNSAPKNGQHHGGEQMNTSLGRPHRGNSVEDKPDERMIQPCGKQAGADTWRMESGDPIEAAHTALCKDDVAGMREVLRRHPELKAHINTPIAQNFDSPPILSVRSRGMLDLFLEAGADINAKSRWWAGGFGLLHTVKPELARYAIERGALVDIHAAARLGMFDRVRELLAGDPKLVHARGGDGQTPLHFASTVAIAEYLVDHGADINARDVDHVSTPAQYMIDDRQEIVRFLIQRGCETDIFMAAALGNLELARNHVKAKPECVRMRVSEEWFPMIGSKNGGTIYQWKLGWHVSPHQVAKKFGREEVARYLDSKSPLEVRLINAAWDGDETAVDALLAQSTKADRSFTKEDLQQVAHAARNNESTAVSLLLKAGLPLNSRGQHNATPLHWAAWHGNAEMVRAILQHGPDLEDNQNDFNGTPMRWAIHGSENGWYKDKGDYGSTVETLLKAGAKPPQKPDGTLAVREALKRGGVG